MGFVIETRELCRRFGAVVAAADVNVAVAEGEVLGVIGANGAGPAHARARLRVGYMPEDRRLVPELTVEENILVPAWANHIHEAASRLAWIHDLIPEVAGFAGRRGCKCRAVSRNSWRSPAR